MDSDKDVILVVTLKGTEYPQVMAKKHKIERMFKVTLTFSVWTGAKIMTVTVKVKGGQRDCVNAKTYIRSSIESPKNESSTIYLPPSITDEFVEAIEIKSLAAITKHASGDSFLISGATLPVSMAMTLLEEHVQTEKWIAENQTTPLKTKSNKASRRLSCALQETLTKVNRRGNYAHASDAVKRAIVGCLLDENEDGQMGAKSDNVERTSESITNKSGEHDVILIEDDSDDELMPIEEADEDDDVMIIETPRKLPNDDGNVFFGKQFSYINDSVIILDTPTDNSKKYQHSGEKEDGLSDVTKAFSELQTPSKLKPDRPNLKDTETAQPTVENNIRDKTKSTEEIKHCEEVNDDTVKNALSSKKKRKSDKKKKKRKLSSTNEERNDVQVSPKSGKIHRKGKTYVPEESARKRRILKSKIVTNNTDKVNKDKSDTGISFITSKSSKENADKGKENAGPSKRKMESKETVTSIDQTQDEVPTRVRKFTRFSDITPKAKNLNTERRVVTIAPRVNILNADISNTSDKMKDCINGDGNDHQAKPTNNDRSAGNDEPDGRDIVNTKLVIPPISDYRTPRRNDLRYIVIDGSNVAMAHGKNSVFSCKGLRICVEYFLRRGHHLITIFLPHWRKCRPHDMTSVTHRDELDKLEKDGYLVYTPSRRIGNKLVAAYDDRFILELADREDGIVVSNDQYRDLTYEKYSWRHIIQTRLLMYSFVHDHFMVPNDPLGRYGPHLNSFLRHTDLRQTLKSLEARNVVPAVQDRREEDFLHFSYR